MQYTKEIYITSIEAKGGIGKNGKEWKNWKITDENQETYTDWSPQYLPMMGQRVTITYEEEQGGPKKNGGYFMNKTIVQKASPQVVQRLQEGAMRTDAEDRAYDRKFDMALDAAVKTTQPPSREWNPPQPHDKQTIDEKLDEILAAVKSILHNQTPPF